MDECNKTIKPKIEGCKLNKKIKLLPPLERNILKLRALQMSLVLFHVEHLKRFVIGSLQATDTVLGTNRFPDGKKPLERAWAIVVEEGILTAEESEQIQELISYRNDIAHKFHGMTLDLSHEKFVQDAVSIHAQRYDYFALNRVRRISKKVSEGFQRKFVMLAGLDQAMFADQEHALDHELKLLARRIDKQYAQRRRLMEAKKSGSS